MGPAVSAVTVAALYGLAIIWGPMLGFAPFLLFRSDREDFSETEYNVRVARWLWTRGLRPALALTAVLVVVLVVDQIGR